MFQEIRALILDMDGVLWRGPQWLIEPAVLFSHLRGAGIRFTFATNNATRTVSYYVDKFAGEGVGIEPWQVMNSGLATANELATRFPEGSEVFVVGEWGLEASLQEKGFRIGADAPVAVVSGMDREITYAKLKTAALLVRAGVPFIGTNPDKSFPTPEGQAPGAGAILAAIEAASGVSPEIIGKPQPTMYRQLLSSLNLRPEQTLVVGDRLETDIAGGQAIGCRTAAVLSGVSTAEMVAAWLPAPDYVFQDLNALVAELVKK